MDAAVEFCGHPLVRGALLVLDRRIEVRSILSAN
jgi:hypothetical protein